MDNRRFPILRDRNDRRRLCPDSIPWAAIAPHERQALFNHEQTLQRLAERGGLGPDEAVAVLENRRWERMDPDAAVKRLLELIGVCPRCGGSGHAPV